MAKRQVWVVEYQTERGSWIAQAVENTRGMAFDYRRFFCEANPKTKTRVVKYVPEETR